MRIAAGVMVLLAAILCFSSGACNLAAGGASRAGKSVIASGIQLLEQSVGSGAVGLTPAERKLLRQRGVDLAGQGDARALAKIKSKTREVMERLEASSAMMLAAGALSLLGGLLAFAAAVLLITERGRGFIVAAMAVAMAGTGLGLFTPFTVAGLVLFKLALLAFGVVAGVTIREEAR